MKKLLLLFVLAISSVTFAQVPQGISYQAIALNGSGAPVVSSNVRVKLSILDVSATGTSVYSETHLKMTNAQGLFNLVIGQGTVVSGIFSTINWGTNSKFLKVEMDAAGGTTYTVVGTTQLLSVPYALTANKLAKDSSNSSNRNIFGSGYNIVYSATEAKAFSGTSWYTTSLTGTVLGTISSNSSTAVFTDSEAKSFSGTSWYTTSLTGTFKGTSSSNSAIAIYTDSQAKAFGGTSWYTTSLNGNVLGSQSSTDNIVIYTDTEAKAFNGTLWYTTSLTGTILGTVANGNSIVIYTTNEIKAFGGTSWYTSSLSGTPIGTN